MDYCPCGSGKTWADCCKPYISGKAKASTAEALMRSRYSAYVKQEIEYIVDTCLRDGERDIDLEQTRRWSEKSKWQGLKVLNVSKGGPSDTEGTVEFVATYEMDGLKDEHHEKAHFKKQGDSWLYVDGDIVPTTIVRSAPKQGRNEPCACGSGKKYKQCCGR